MSAERIPEDAADAPATAPTPARETSRRRFMQDAAVAGGVATVGWFWGEGFYDATRRERVEPTVPGAPPKTFTAVEWRTLEAACDRLLPSEGPSSPGARDVNAIGYLDAVLAEAFVEEKVRRTIRQGAAILDGRVGRRMPRNFAALSPAKQDAVIGEFETARAPDGSHPGHRWLRYMLGFILEAFFGDPVHGGNPDEIAWKWAGHRPGFPRPTEKDWRPTERKA